MSKNVVEFVETAIRGLTAQWSEWCDTRYSLNKFYKNKDFKAADLELSRRYWGRSAFGISRNFLKQQGESDIHSYGETPLRTLAEMTERCGLGATDCIFELGCGRGRGCLWWRAMLGCRVVGVEIVPEFVNTAIEVIEKLEWEQIEFRKEDFRETDLAEATFVYLTGTCFDDEALRELGERFRSLPPRSRVLSVSSPIELENVLEVVDAFPVKFHWGSTEAYLQMRI